MKIRITTDNHFHKGEPVAKGAVLEVDDIDGKIILEAKAGEETKAAITAPTAQEG